MFRLHMAKLVSSCIDSLKFHVICDDTDSGKFITSHTYTEACPVRDTFKKRQIKDLDNIFFSNIQCLILLIKNFNLPAVSIR